MIKVFVDPNPQNSEGRMIVLEFRCVQGGQMNVIVDHKHRRGSLINWIRNRFLRIYHD